MLSAGVAPSDYQPIGHGMLRPLCHSVSVRAIASPIHGICAIGAASLWSKRLVPEDLKALVPLRQQPSDLSRFLVLSYGVAHRSV
jgi:hypothetical protein